METKIKTILTVESTIKSPVEKVWEYWTLPNHIMQWNNASDEWHTPYAANDLQPGGRFVSRMEAKDGTIGFDFAGIYNEVRSHEYIEYTIADGRKVKINFSVSEGSTKLVESFEAEDTHSPEIQQAGWQAILNNFKRYAEAHS